MKGLFLRTSIALSSFFCLSLANSSSATAKTHKLAVFQQSDWVEVLEARSELENEYYHVYLNQRTAYRNGDQVTFDFKSTQQSYHRFTVQCDRGLATAIRTGGLTYGNTNMFPNQDRMNYLELNSTKWLPVEKSPVFTYACRPGFAPAQQAKSYNHKLKIDSLGDIKIGMTLDQLIEQLGGSLDISHASKDASCLMINSPKLPDGLGIMLTDGELSMFSVYAGSVKTLSGVGIGDSKQKAFGAYPNNLQVTGKTLSGRGEVLTYVPNSSQHQPYRLVLETSWNGKITGMRAGKRHEVKTHLEGCA